MKLNISVFVFLQQLKVWLTRILGLFWHWIKRALLHLQSGPSQHPSGHRVQDAAGVRH